jgi:hypothetical protein
LFSWRQEGDYEDFVYFKKEDVEPLIQPSKELIGEIVSLIKAQLFYNLI